MDYTTSARSSMRRRRGWTQKQRAAFVRWYVRTLIWSRGRGLPRPNRLRRVDAACDLLARMLAGETLPGGGPLDSWLAEQIAVAQVAMDVAEEELQIVIPRMERNAGSSIRRGSEVLATVRDGMPYPYRDFIRYPDRMVLIWWRVQVECRWQQFGLAGPCPFTQRSWSPPPKPFNRVRHVVSCAA